MRSKQNPNVSLAQFVIRIRDDAARFQVLYERAQREQPGLLTDERSLRGWALYFFEFLRGELGLAVKRKRIENIPDRPRSNATTVFKHRSRPHRTT